ncbi:unnamed protein product [Symbiodinium natans]|uniref:Uncharacterized protein n=1 Tax=Symbiodinium natans TaxID=878477 RepID=A0A812KNV8_9DINO|nr:unnamed protein product [Symbiodinium natans]
METSEIEAEGDAEERANRRKRDALRGDKPVQFSMFDPVVAYDAISNNWINVAEVAKLGIQAAHKKLGVAREERLELQVSLDNLRQQLRGMQEHHVHQMDIMKIRLEILEKIAKRKKKYRNGQVPTTEQLEQLPRHRMRGGEQTTGGRSLTVSKEPPRSSVRPSKPRGSERRSGQQRDSLSHFLSQEEDDGSSSDDSSVQGITQEQQTLMDKIEPLGRQVEELKTGLRKEGQKSDALHKQIAKQTHHIDMLENRINDELSTRALSLLFRQVVFTDLPATLENFVQDKMLVFRKQVDALDRKMEAESSQRKTAMESVEKKVTGLTGRVGASEETIQAIQALVDSRSSSSEEEEEEQEAKAPDRETGSSFTLESEIEARDVHASAVSPRSSRAAESFLSRPDLHPDLWMAPDAAGHELEVDDGSGSAEDFAQEEAVAEASADEVSGRPCRVSLPLPIAKRQLPSNASSQDPSQVTELSAGVEGGLDEAGVPMPRTRTVETSESSVLGPADDAEGQAETQRTTRWDTSSSIASQFFPRTKTRKGFEEPSPQVSPKSTKGGSTRRRSRLEKTVSQKEQPESGDEELVSPNSMRGIGNRRASRSLQKVEEALTAVIRMKHAGGSEGDKSFSLEDFATSAVNLPIMQEALQAQKEDGDRLREGLLGVSERMGALEATAKELAESVQQLRELSDMREQEASCRLANVEGRTDGEFQRVIALAEERVMSFLRESELERARLWHQMSVLFPRFIQDEEEDADKKMTLTEARMYALDIRLDTLEGGIIRLLARDPQCMPKPRRRYTRRVQDDPDVDLCVANRSPSPQQGKRHTASGVVNRSPSPLQMQGKRNTASGEEGDCATHASVSPSSSPEPRPLQLPTLDQAKPGSRDSKLRELLLRQQDLLDRQVSDDQGHGESRPLPTRPASAAQATTSNGRDLIAHIATALQDPHLHKARHPSSGMSLESAVLDVMEEARSAYDDVAEAMRGLGQSNPNSGRWRAGDAASGRVLEQAQGISHQSAKQRKAFRPWSPPYKPFRPVEHLRGF